MAWRDLADLCKARGIPVVCEDERPLPSFAKHAPLLHPILYLLAYGRYPRGVLLADQGDGMRLAPLLLLARIRRRMRVLVVVHHLRESFRYRNRIYVGLATQAENAMLRLAHRVVVSSHDTASEVMARGVRPDRIELIPQGIRHRGQPIEILRLEAGEPLKLLWIGGDFVRKGLWVLLEALSMSADPRPTVTVVGQPLDPGDVQVARARAAGLGVADHITFLGFVPQERLDSLWSQHDVFVLPSFREGHALVLDEALIRGMPVVTTDLPVFRERIRPDEAVLCPPGDAQALARSLFELRDEGRRRTLSAKGQARARTFPQWEATLDHYEALLRRVFATLP